MKVWFDLGPASLWKVVTNRTRGDWSDAQPQQAPAPAPTPRFGVAPAPFELSANRANLLAASASGSTMAGSLNSGRKTLLGVN